MKKNAPTLWPFFLVIFVTAAFSLTPASMFLEENLGLRLLFWLRGPVEAPKNVVVASIDENSAALLDLPDPDELSQWPRSVHAEVIDRLVELGAQVIAFDIAFNQTSADLEQDRALADSLARANNVVLLKLMEKFNVDSDSQAFSVEQILMPAAPFREKAKIVASFTLSENSIKKHAEVFKQTPQGLGPTMPMGALLVYAEPTFRSMAEFISLQVPDSLQFEKGIANADLRELAIHVRSTLQQRPDLQRIIKKQFLANEALISGEQFQLGQALLAGLSASDPLYLNFYGPRHTVTHIPYANFFAQGTETLPDLHGKAVFIGLSETRTKQRDYFYTIFPSSDDLRYSGVEIAATLFANLVDGNQLRSFSRWQILLLVLSIGGVIVIALIYLPLRPWLVFSTALSVTYVILWYVLFIRYHYWLPLISPVAILALLLVILGLAFHHRQSILLSEATASTLQHYLPKQVALQMRDNLQKIRHQRQTTQAVCLLTDLVGFTALAERVPAAQLHELMNRYYVELTQIIQRHNGTIANIVGDGLLALWTGIELNIDLKNSACQAAVDIVKRFSTPEFDNFKTCIGIHGGEISLGNLGAEGHFEYAPVGDTINTTARVEAYNRKLGTQVLLTDAVGADIRLFRTQYHGKVLFKGKTKAVGVYELLTPELCSTEL